jgi:hypothetical protein
LDRSVEKEVLRLLDPQGRYTSKPERLSPLWLLLVPFLALAAAPAFARPGRQIEFGPVVLAVGIRRGSGYRQGLSRERDRGGSGLVLRLGDWHWGLGLRRRVR